MNTDTFELYPLSVKKKDIANEASTKTTKKIDYHVLKDG